MPNPENFTPIRFILCRCVFYLWRLSICKAPTRRLSLSLALSGISSSWQARFPNQLVCSLLSIFQRFLMPSQNESFIIFNFVGRYVFLPLFQNIFHFSSKESDRTTTFQKDNRQVTCLVPPTNSLYPPYSLFNLTQARSITSRSPAAVNTVISSAVRESSLAHFL